MGLWASTYPTTGQVSINGHYGRNSSTLPKQGTCFPSCSRNSLAAEPFHQCKERKVIYCAHTSTKVRDSHEMQKCWEQRDAQHGQILLQTSILSNSVYETAKHLDRGFLKIRCTLLGFKHVYLGLFYKVCSLKMFVKLGFVTQLEPEQEKKTKAETAAFLHPCFPFWYHLNQ